MELERISLTIDKDLMRRFDEMLERTGRSNRSEAIRDLIRARMVEEDWKDDQSDNVATITIVYDHEKRELAERLTHKGHEHHEEILASMHIHLDDRNCLEVIAARGKTRDLKHIADHVIGLKGVKHGRIVLTSGRFEDDEA